MENGEKTHHGKVDHMPSLTLEMKINTFTFNFFFSFSELIQIFIEKKKHAFLINDYYVITR